MKSIAPVTVLAVALCLAPAVAQGPILVPSTDPTGQPILIPSTDPTGQPILVPSSPDPTPAPEPPPAPEPMPPVTEPDPPAPEPAPEPTVREKLGRKIHELCDKNKATRATGKDRVAAVRKLIESHRRAMAERREHMREKAKGHGKKDHGRNHKSRRH